VLRKKRRYLSSSETGEESSVESVPRGKKSGENTEITLSCLVVGNSVAHHSSLHSCVLLLIENSSCNSAMPTSTV
jgi:hypothetical protein